MNIYFLPPGSDLNISLNMIVDGLEYNGAKVVNKAAKQGAVKKFLSSYSAYFKGARIFHLNFVENYSAKKTKKSQILCCLIFLWLDSLKLLGGKIVWTMNNKESHYCTGDKTFHLNFMKKFISKMDMIVVYCEESKEILLSEYNYPADRICSVAHGCFVPEKKLERQSHTDGKVHILSFGLISRYKNIPLMVESFKEANPKNLILRIYGRCENKELENKIASLCAGCKQIELYNGFVPEEKVNDLFAWADVAVFPYSKESMLNSGAVIMALSQGKVILVSEFGYIKEIKDKSFIFSYDYSDVENHKEVLKKKFQDLDQMGEATGTVDNLSALGEEAYNFAHDTLDWKAICKKIVDYYTELLA